ncbi:hypothetical protein ATANTOWER_012923, partial [Ataeniobius toweri]|nr:hypothetical protein [Ataeniobius toweri]
MFSCVLHKCDLNGRVGRRKNCYKKAIRSLVCSLLSSMQGKPNYNILACWSTMHGGKLTRYITLYTASHSETWLRQYHAFGMFFSKRPENLVRTDGKMDGAKYLANLEEN